MSEDSGDRSRFWPIRWMTDETFWRDVASQAVSTFVVLVIGVIWASASGWLNPSVPVVAARWGAVIVGFVLVAMGVAMVLIVVGASREMERREGKGRRYAIVTSLVLGTMFLVGAAPYVIGLVQGTMFGTKL